MSDQRFARVILAIGPEHFHRLQNASVCIVGLGAVGGFAAEGLVRSGVGRLRLIDVDTVQITNINRQITAAESTLGWKKTKAAAARMKDINPGIKLELFGDFFHYDTAEKLLDPSIDFVVDAIDAAGPKIELLAFCYRAGIPIISVMGAAYKTDLSSIRIVDIAQTQKCPLARVIRRGLHRKGIHTGIEAIYSPEPGPPVQNPADVTDPDCGTVTHRGRPRRILGSLCPVPAIFGMMAAHHVILKLGRTENSRIVPSSRCPG
ncbi:tRNA threonylcarbamoyladenosine dehydratase [bacterium]|nr:tRNA threonylcarbamoyladenosine dehydratase [candidate division CSSED10-310 bacterium]